MSAPVSRIINTDWPALAMAVGAPIALVVTWIPPVLFRSSKAPDSPDWLFLHVGIPLACACLVVLLWRVGRIRKLFRQGVPVVGIITDLTFFKDRGRVEFSYVLDGITYASWQPVHQSRSVLALEVGQEVGLLVSHRDPSLAIIRHLFESASSAST